MVHLLYKCTIQGTFENVCLARAQLGEGVDDDPKDDVHQNRRDHDEKEQRVQHAVKNAEAVPILAFHKLSEVSALVYLLYKATIQRTFEKCLPPSHPISSMASPRSPLRRPMSRTTKEHFQMDVQRAPLLLGSSLRPPMMSASANWEVHTVDQISKVGQVSKVSKVIE